MKHQNASVEQSAKVTTGKKRQVKAAGPRAIPDTGLAAILFDGGCIGLPNTELGPDAALSKNQDYSAFVNSAIHWAAGTDKKAFDQFPENRASRGLVFSPYRTSDYFFASSAMKLGEDEMPSLAQLVTARKNIKWVQTRLCEGELMACVRSYVKAMNPDWVAVWPAQYFFQKTGDALKRYLLEGSGWQLHEFEPRPARAANRGLKPDPDEPGDWWKAE